MTFGDGVWTVFGDKGIEKYLSCVDVIKVELQSCD